TGALGRFLFGGTLYDDSRLLDVLLFGWLSQHLVSERIYFHCHIFNLLIPFGSHFWFAASIHSGPGVTPRRSPYAAESGTAPSAIAEPQAPPRSGADLAETKF